MKLISLSLFALVAATAPIQAKLNIIATTADLGAIAREVGGTEVKVTVLAKPTEDPHFVEPKPSFLVHLNRADLLIEGGAELEKGWLGGLVAQSRNAKLLEGARGHLAASEGVEMLEVPVSLDRAQGDIHAAGNPHFLVDPENAKIVARNMARKFCELDAPSCGKYEDNLRHFLARLEEKMKQWQKTMAPHQGKRIAAYHNSWPYFGQRFGVKIDLFLEPKPGIPPTPANLASVIEQMKKENVKAIICDPYLNHKTAEKVAADTGATVVETSHFPGGIKGVKEDYISLIEQLVNSMAGALAK